MAEIFWKRSTVFRMRRGLIFPPGGWDPGGIAPRSRAAPQPPIPSAVQHHRTARPATFRPCRGTAIPARMGRNGSANTRERSAATPISLSPAPLPVSLPGFPLPFAQVSPSHDRSEKHAHHSIRSLSRPSLPLPAGASADHLRLSRSSPERGSAGSSPPTARVRSQAPRSEADR